MQHTVIIIIFLKDFLKKKLQLKACDSTYNIVCFIFYILNCSKLYFCIFLKSEKKKLTIFH